MIEGILGVIGLVVMAMGMVYIFPFIVILIVLWAKERGTHDSKH